MASNFKNLESLPEATAREKYEKERLHFLITLLYFTGLRINELTTHTWGAFRKVQYDWWFWVIGKGDKLGKIPVNDELLQTIIRYRTHLGCSSALPQPDETNPIIASTNKNKALTPRHINKLLKKLALLTIKLHFYDRPEKAEKLRKFSAHWLRHFSASMQDRAGMQFKHIRANLRHENDETTRRYVHAWDKERHEEMKKLSLKVTDGSMHSSNE